MKTLTLILLVFGLALPLRTFGWSMPGHMIAAEIAWSELSPEEQQAVDTILQKHVYSAQWDAAYPGSSFAVSKPLFRVMLACLYPDEIRDYNVPSTFAYWHFVDYPLHSPDFPLDPRPQPTNDVIYGIQQSESAIESEQPGADRGKMMSFLLHLVGDIHQPLHCETLFNDDFNTTDGDKGGNYAYVDRPEDQTLGLKGGKINLHAVWDELFGTGGSPFHFPSSTVVLAVYHQAQQIKQKYTREQLTELKTDTTPTAWSIESRTKAINDAWKKGTLAYVAEDFSGDKPKPPAGVAPALPDGYMAHAHDVADRCIALAGYRLADELHQVLKVVNAHGIQNGDPNAPQFQPTPARAADSPAANNAASPDSTRVWVNTKSGIYWPEGSEYYGENKKKGEYMTEADAKAKGYRSGVHGR